MSHFSHLNIFAMLNSICFYTKIQAYVSALSLSSLQKCSKNVSLTFPLSYEKNIILNVLRSFKASSFFLVIQT